MAAKADHDAQHLRLQLEELRTTNRLLSDRSEESQRTIAQLQGMMSAAGAAGARTAPASHGIFTGVGWLGAAEADASPAVQIVMLTTMRPGCDCELPRYKV